MPVDEDGILQLIGKWKPVLSLSDWDIRAVVVRNEWRKSGDVKIDLSNSMAAVLVRHDLNPGNLEEVVVHELLHLKLYALDQFIEESLNALYGTDLEEPGRNLAQGFFMHELETAVQDLTRALLSATGYSGEYLDRRLVDEIAGEIGINEER